MYDADLPDAFNLFFARFERPLSHDVPKLRESLTPLNDIEISQNQVITPFKKTKIGKAAGHDAICGRTLRYCADQLGGIFTTLFQLCANSGQIPNSWKQSTIIPIPKSKNPKELKKYRPIALTSLVVKSFDKILKDEIISLTLDKLDPLQFAYQAGKGVEDAKLFILDGLYKHLEQPKSHARLLFADFSSAFNKMQPHILIERLSSHFMLLDQILLMILNFLTNRLQQVFVNGRMSSVIQSNIGSPSGLSPFSPAFYSVHRQLQILSRKQLSCQVFR